MRYGSSGCLYEKMNAVRRGFSTCFYGEMNTVRCAAGILHTLNEFIALDYEFIYIKAKCTVSSQSGVHVFFIILYANTIALLIKF